MLSVPFPLCLCNQPLNGSSREFVSNAQIVNKCSTQENLPTYNLPSSPVLRPEKCHGSIRSITPAAVQRRGVVYNLYLRMLNYAIRLFHMITHLNCEENHHYHLINCNKNWQQSAYRERFAFIPEQCIARFQYATFASNRKWNPECTSKRDCGFLPAECRARCFADQA